MCNPNSNRATKIYYSQRINGTNVTTNELELAKANALTGQRWQRTGLNWEKPAPTHFKGQMDRSLNLEEGGDTNISSESRTERRVHCRRHSTRTGSSNNPSTSFQPPPHRNSSGWCHYGNSSGHVHWQRQHVSLESTFSGSGGIVVA